MTSSLAPDTIDTRLVLRVYSVVGMVGGIAAFVLAAALRGGWSDLGATGAAALSLTGALAWAFTSYAAALSRVEDPVGRLAGLREFTVAHVIVAVFLLTVHQAIQSAVDRVGMYGAFVLAIHPLLATNLLITAAVLAYVVLTANPRHGFTSTVRSNAAGGDGRRAMTVREKAPLTSTRHLRAQYEEQIRLAARQEERARLARDLHDAVKQQLFVVQTAAATVDARFDSDQAGARQAVVQVRTAAREAMSEMEAMLDQLQAAPVEHGGLAEALKTQAEALGFRTGAAVSVEIDAAPPPRPLPPGAEQAIFRVAQEALANIGRHARAQHVLVRLRTEASRLLLEITDDGSGFDPLAGRSGRGITNMQERAADVGGSFELASSPGRGTTILFAVPFVGRPAAAYLRRAFAAVAVLVACAALAAWDNLPWQPLRLALVWIAVIALARYMVAYVRVMRRR